MTLTNIYVQSLNKLPTLFERIKGAQVPQQFTQQLLKDWGLSSSNDRAFIPLLKALGFLNADGIPTRRYSEYRNNSKSESIMGAAIKEAYEDIFLISASPSSKDKSQIVGKFKSYHNTSDNLANLMYRTFDSLMKLADIEGHHEAVVPTNESPEVKVKEPVSAGLDSATSKPKSVVGLHYNIQVHLPATKDIEVYNAIFKSIKEHLIE